MKEEHGKEAEHGKVFTTTPRQFTCVDELSEMHKA
jgi:hypothetical protein